jgi:ligand-binding sensor domain-containing protein
MITNQEIRQYFLFLVFIYVIAGLSFDLYAQSSDGIPVGTWRAHLSFNNIISVAQSRTTIFAASEMGLLEYDKSDHSLTTLNKLNGLSSSGITCLAYDDQNNQLIIGYSDGNIDLLKGNSVSNFSALKNPNTVIGSKKINHISVQHNLAYISTDYGVVVFDVVKQELKETWRNLGRNGTDAAIYQTTFLGDSIVAATDKGFIIGNLNDNLLDFAKWERNDAGDFSNGVSFTTVFNNIIYVAVNGKGIYRRAGSAFVKEDMLVNSTISLLGSSEQHLLIGANSNLWLMDKNELLQQVADDMVTSPSAAIEDSPGTLWIADAKNGLLSNESGTFQNYLPNGPSITRAFRLRYVEHKMYALAGGFSNTGLPLHNDGTINYFENGTWKQKQLDIRDVTDVISFNGRILYASFGDGIADEHGDGVTTLYDNTNSTLEDMGGSEKEINITSFQYSTDGMYVSEYGAIHPLHLLSNDNTWTSFNVLPSAAPYTVKMTIDLNGNLWLIPVPVLSSGVVVYSPEKNAVTVRTTLAGFGGLPNNTVLSAATDRDGYVWLGTASGIGYFYAADEDIVLPIFDNRFLLKDEKITALVVDGGNRKWVGTENGVWLFDPTGETLIRNFSQENSPLLSNKIIDIAINNETGEVFFATDKGIISYGSDATPSENKFNSIKIFPNPVTYDFSGTVGITGLYTDAIVKITDVSGKLVWQSRAEGGMAIWNVKDVNGRRASTGIYLVFASAQDGSESVVGKIAVID